MWHSVGVFLERAFWQNIQSCVLTLTDSFFALRGCVGPLNYVALSLNVEMARMTASRHNGIYAVPSLKSAWPKDKAPAACHALCLLYLQIVKYVNDPDMPTGCATFCGGRRNCTGQMGAESIFQFWRSKPGQ